jgi:hypothetical protein
LIEAKGYPVNKGKKQVPTCRMGAQDRPGKAQRYGTIQTVLWKYGRPGLAVRPAAWSATADLTAGMAKAAIAAASFFRKKRYSGKRGAR